MKYEHKLRKSENNSFVLQTHIYTLHLIVWNRQIIAHKNKPQYQIKCELYEQQQQQ